MPLSKLDGWLFSINPAKVREDKRELVERYQEECFVVLHDYWTKGQATNPRHDQPAINFNTIQSMIRQEVSQSITSAFTMAMEGIVSKMVEKQVAVTVEAQLKDDPRITVESMVSARQILDEEKVPSKKQRGLVVSASHSLIDYCIQNGLTPQALRSDQDMVIPRRGQTSLVKSRWP